MLSMLIFWDASGAVVGTLAHLVARDEDGEVLGLVDFEAHERAGGRIREIADVSNATGGGSWPEWLDGGVLDFRVELDPNPGQARAKIAALVHKKSGYRRDRASIEAAIAERTNEAKAEAQKKGKEQRALLRAKGVPEETVVEFTDPPVKVDLRDLLGGPNKPLLVDDDGKTMKKPKVERPNLPIVGRG